MPKITGDEKGHYRMLLNIASVAKTKHAKQLYGELKDYTTDVSEGRDYDPQALNALKQKMARNRATQKKK